MSATDDFRARLLLAMKTHSESGSSEEGGASDALSTQEEETYEHETDQNAETLAEIKQAQALLDEKQNKIKRKLLKGRVVLQKQDTLMRREYASKAYWFVWLWSIALIVIILLQGSTSPRIKILFIEFYPHDFNLEPNVLIALISGVTVNIVAVFVVVIRNLFPSDAKIDKEDKSTKED